MRSNIDSVERRLKHVEKELADLKSAISRNGRLPWYREIAGSFAADPAYAEIIRLGRIARRGRRKE